MTSWVTSYDILINFENELYQNKLHVSDKSSKTRSQNNKIFHTENGPCAILKNSGVILS